MYVHQWGASYLATYIRMMAGCLRGRRFDNRYLEAIYSYTGVKVTQGYACHGPFPWLISAVISLTLQLP